MDGSTSKAPSGAGDGSLESPVDDPVPQQEPAESLDGTAEADGNGTAASAKPEEEKQGSDAEDHGQPPSPEVSNAGTEDLEISQAECNPELYEEEEFEELQSTPRDSSQDSPRSVSTKDGISPSRLLSPPPATPSPVEELREKEVPATPAPSVATEEKSEEDALFSSSASCGLEGAGATAAKSTSSEETVDEAHIKSLQDDEDGMLSNMPTDPNDLAFLKKLRRLMDGKGVPVQVLGQTLLQIPHAERVFTQHRFENLFHQDLLEGLKHSLGPDWAVLIETLLEENKKMFLEYSRMPMEVKVRRLHAGLDATNRSLFQTLVAASDIDMPILRRKYREQYGVDLAVDLQRKCKHPTMKFLKLLVCKDPSSTETSTIQKGSICSPPQGSFSMGAESRKAAGTKIATGAPYAAPLVKRGGPIAAKKATTPGPVAPRKTAGPSSTLIPKGSSSSGLSVPRSASSNPTTPKGPGAKSTVPTTPKGPVPMIPRGPVPATPKGPASTTPKGPASTTPKGPASTTPKGPASTTPKGPASTTPKGPAPTTPKGPAPTTPKGPVPTTPKGPAPTTPKGPVPTTPKGPAPTPSIPTTPKSTGARPSVSSTPKGPGTVSTASKSSQTKAAPVKKTASAVSTSKMTSPATPTPGRVPRPTKERAFKTASEKDVTAPTPTPLGKAKPEKGPIRPIPEKKSTGAMGATNPAKMGKGDSSDTPKKEPLKREGAVKKETGTHPPLPAKTVEAKTVMPKKGRITPSIPPQKVASAKKVAPSSGPAVKSSSKEVAARKSGSKEVAARKSVGDATAKILSDVGPKEMKGKQSPLPTKDFPSRLLRPTTARPKTARPTTAKLRNAAGDGTPQGRVTAGTPETTDQNTSNSNVAGIEEKILSWNKGAIPKTRVGSGSSKASSSLKTIPSQRSRSFGGSSSDGTSTTTTDYRSTSASPNQSKSAKRARASIFYSESAFRGASSMSMSSYQSHISTDISGCESGSSGSEYTIHTEISRDTSSTISNASLGTCCSRFLSPVISLGTVSQASAHDYLLDEFVPMDTTAEEASSAVDSAEEIIQAEAISETPESFD